MAVMLMETGREPRLQRIKHAHAGARRRRAPIALRRILLHRVLRAAQLAGDACDAPAKRVQWQQTGDIIGRMQGERFLGKETRKGWGQRACAGTSG